MKQTISIFVSGAKRLKEHRMMLKVLANDMNGELRKKGQDIIINMYSYMNLGDDQKEYDDFIEHRSDIVFFIIEDKLGEKTRDEFLLALEAYKKTGAPKIYIFLKEFNERTPEIEEIEKLVNNNYSSYYIEYSNLDDLVAKVRKRLQQDIDEKLDKLNATPEKKVRKYKNWAIVSTLLLLLSLIGAGIYSLFNKSADDVVLLFAGGGSALSCMEHTCEAVGDLNQYENSISISMPSSNAWSLVSSEVLHHHAIKNDNVKMPFYPVCLSATPASESDFLHLTDRDQFLKMGSIISVHVGDDRLMVYVKKTLDHELINGKDSITAKDLCTLINVVLEKDYNVFSTQAGSGTLLAYRNLLSPLGVDISSESMGDNLKWFSQTTPSNKIRRNEQPYIILGSEFYTNDEVYQQGDCRGLVVVDDNNESIKKSVYIYFAGYYHGEEGNSFWIPDEMVEFLKKINPKYGDVIKGNLIPRRNEMVSVPLDDELPKD